MAMEFRRLETAHSMFSAGEKRENARHMITTHVDVYTHLPPFLFLLDSPKLDGVQRARRCEGASGMHGSNPGDGSLPQAMSLRGWMDCYLLHRTTSSKITC
jgi:hypothetical protein